MQAVRQILHPKKNEVSITVPESFIDKDVEVLILPVESKKKSYDFSSLAGKLEWSGDAVKEQRALRDEW